MEYDLSQLSAQEGYRLLTGVVVPRPIAWVSTLGEEGTINVAPFSFFNILGSDPPTIGIGVGNRKDGSPKDTAANILRSGEFVVNLVDEANAEAMNVTAIEFPPGISELTEAGLTAAPSVRVTAPRIAEAKVCLECRLFQVVANGNNRILIATVEHVHVREGETPETFRFIGRTDGPGGYVRTRDRFEIARIRWTDWRGRSEN
ncbi:MAG: flavin reductase family protein [Capsulimonadales bacterium]|nr:flavin reductase family protein [Capsulimonadales bacterium]